MNDMPEQNIGNEKKKKKKLLILLLIFLIVVIAGCIFGFMKMSGNKEASDSGSTAASVGLTIDENAVAKVETQDESSESEPGVAIPGWGSITIPAGETEITSVDFYNPEANEGYYYLTFELRIPDDSSEGYEVIYASQLVPPGQHLQKITLSRPLEAGEYDAIVHVQPYRMDEAQTPTNNADMETTLIVE